MDLLATSSLNYILCISLVMSQEVLLNPKFTKRHSLAQYFRRCEYF